MVDKELLEAIGQMMDKRIAPVNQRLDRLEQQQSEVAKNTIVLMDAEFSKRFDLLAEGQQDILERLVPRSRVDDLEDEVKFLKSIVRQMNEDIQQLKKAN